MSPIQKQVTAPRWLAFLAVVSPACAVGGIGYAVVAKDATMTQTVQRLEVNDTKQDDLLTRLTLIAERQTVLIESNRHEIDRLRNSRTQ